VATLGLLTIHVFKASFKHHWNCSNWVVS